jgi:hypothetical protein
MAKYFREVGFENVALTASSSINGSLIIAAPGAGLSIYLLGASTFDDIRLHETNGSGANIVNIGGGMSNFPSTIKVKENIGVWLVTTATAGVTLFYYIDNS